MGDSSKSHIDEVLNRLREYEKNRAENVETFNLELQRYHADFNREVAFRNEALKRSSDSIQSISSQLEEFVAKTGRDAVLIDAGASKQASKAVDSISKLLDELLATRDLQVTQGLTNMQTAHKLRMEKLHDELAARKGELTQAQERKRILQGRISTMEEQASNLNSLLTSTKTSRPDDLVHLEKSIKDTEDACMQIKSQIDHLKQMQEDDAKAEEEEKRLRIEIASVQAQNRDLEISLLQSSTHRKHLQAAAMHARQLRREVTDFQVLASKSARPRTAENLRKKQDHELFKLLEQRGISLFPVRSALQRKN